MMHTVRLPSPPSRGISRRRVLRLGLLAAAVPCVAGPALALERTAQPCERSLAFSHVHTGESLTTVYWSKGVYMPAALRDMSDVLRDHHSDEVTAIDPPLLDLLYTLDRLVGLRDAFHILSAYRSPATNAMLRLSHAGVAEHSMHVEGKAVDVRFFGRDLLLVHRLATDLRGGGIGYDPRASCVHLDTGLVRSW
jgi:uncharacterized protein YcbK (DUF882 family)